VAGKQQFTARPGAVGAGPGGPAAPVERFGDPPATTFKSKLGFYASATLLQIPAGYAVLALPTLKNPPNRVAAAPEVGSVTGICPTWRSPARG
jgi:hypothetical protein